jgi:hypothetical protein
MFHHPPQTFLFLSNGEPEEAARRILDQLVDMDMDMGMGDAMRDGGGGGDECSIHATTTASTSTATFESMMETVVKTKATKTTGASPAAFSSPSSRAGSAVPVGSAVRDGASDEFRFGDMPDEVKQRMIDRYFITATTVSELDAGAPSSSSSSGSGALGGKASAKARAARSLRTAAKAARKAADHYAKGKVARGKGFGTMYRDGQVVSQKGEKYTLVPKETRDQIKANSVSLAWIKGKAARGPGYGKMSAPGVNVDEWKKRRK